MAEDVFGHGLPDDDDGDLPAGFGAENDLETQYGDVQPSGPPQPPDAPRPDGEKDPFGADVQGPTDPAGARKFWQGVYTKSRQADRAKYGKMSEEHQQYQQVLANFYKDDKYALQVISERFPQLAKLLGGALGQPATAGSQSASHSVADQLQQNLGEYGFLAKALGPVIERIIEERVSTRVAPVEHVLTQQAAQRRTTEENELLTAMDGKYPGWEEAYGGEMQALDEFLGSDALTHPKFGNKYELYYRLLNPDVSRIGAARGMLDAARRRSGVSQGSGRATPNLAEQISKAASPRDAFRLAAQAAMENSR